MRIPISPYGRREVAAAGCLALSLVLITAATLSVRAPALLLAEALPVGLFAFALQFSVAAPRGGGLKTAAPEGRP